MEKKNTPEGQDPRLKSHTGKMLVNLMASEDGKKFIDRKNNEKRKHNIRVKTQKFYTLTYKI